MPESFSFVFSILFVPLRIQYLALFDYLNWFPGVPGREFVVIRHILVLVMDSRRFVVKKYGLVSHPHSSSRKQWLWGRYLRSSSSPC